MNSLNFYCPVPSQTKVLGDFCFPSILHSYYMAGLVRPSCPLGTTHSVPREKFPQKPNNKSFIDQAFPVKMAGYWPRSFLRVYGPRHAID